MANELKEALVQAMETLAGAAVQESNAAKTIEAIILECLDSDTGLYSVNYLGTKLQVYSSNPSVSYSIDDAVYVLIPEGNFDKKKIILGYVDPDKVIDRSDWIESEYYLNISGNLLSGADDTTLCSYTVIPEGEDRAKKDLSADLFETNFHTIFNYYLTKTKLFYFEVGVKTLLDYHQKVKASEGKADYGINLSFTFVKTLDNGKLEYLYRDYSLNTKTMLGNAFGFSTWAKQRLEIEVEEGYTLAENPKCYIYKNNQFLQDASKTEVDILFKNLQFSAMSVINQTSTGAFLFLESTGGQFFLGGETVKQLSATLRVKGENVSFSGRECFWFEESPRTTPGDAGYYECGGRGWKICNKWVDTPDGGYYDDEYTMLNVGYDEVPVRKKFKFCCYYKQVLLSAEIELGNGNGDYSCEVITDNGNTEFLKDSGGAINLICDYQGKLDYNYNFYWELFNKNGEFLKVIADKVVGDEEVTKLAMGHYQCATTLPIANIDEVGTVKCTVYIKEDEDEYTYIASDELLLTTTDKLVYRLNILNGDKLFKYDTNGCSPFHANYAGDPATNELLISPLGFKVYKDDGSELTEEEYLACRVQWRVPKRKNPMVKIDEGMTLAETQVEGYTTYTNRELIYRISDAFVRNSAENDIILIVDYGNKHLEEATNIRFIKDGETGTNGSEYSAMILHQGVPYNALKEFGTDEDKTYKPWRLALVYCDGAWTTNTGDNTLEVKVYKGAEELTSGFSVTWSWFDPKKNFINSNYLHAINGSETIATISPNIGMDFVGGNYYIAQAYIKINEEEGIYAHYPIEQIWMRDGFFDALKTEEDNDDTNPAWRNKYLPHIRGGFNYVTYAADATNPQYTTDENFYLDNFTFEKNELSYWCDAQDKAPHNISLGFDLDKTETDAETGEVTITRAPGRATPISRWINRKPAAIKVWTGQKSDDVVDATGQIQMYSKPILFLINRYGMANLNAWDGSAIDINEEDGYILAPQLGAGKKETDNSFTGMVMGVRVAKGKEDVGLFGYSKGEQSIYMDAYTGYTALGISDYGQIIFDPTEKTAKIKSNNYSETDGTGMEINLTTPSIKFGSGNFIVDANGNVTANNGTFTGKVHAERGSIDGTLTFGSEGEITLKNATNNYTVTLRGVQDNTGCGVFYITDPNGDWPFKVNGDGSLLSTKGTIGGWNIAPTFLSASYGNGGLWLYGPSTTHSYWLQAKSSGGSEVFSIKKDGTLFASGQLKVTSGGTIGGWTVGTYSLYNGPSSYGDGSTLGTYIGTDGIRQTGSSGYVTIKDGVVTASKAFIIGQFGSLTDSSSVSGIGRFTVDWNSFYDTNTGWKYDDDDSDANVDANHSTPNIFIACENHNHKYNIAGQRRNDWWLGVGKNFGVTDDGTVYCSAINITGSGNDDGSGTINSTSVLGPMKIMGNDLITIPLGSAGDGSSKITFEMRIGKHSATNEQYSENCVFSIVAYGPGLSSSAYKRKILLAVKQDGSVIS